MGLVIHDLNAEAWEQVSKDYDGWTVVSDRGTIHPCVGCFSCWNRTPGRCVIRDGYEDMGVLIHRAEEVVVISRYTYGGFSGFVKNVFDRCLGYVLPQFEVTGGETHHQRRYDEEKPFTFIFYGRGLTQDQKESARRYVRAVCANIRGRVKEVIFRECEEKRVSRPDPAGTVPQPADHGIPQGRTVLLNGSMRSANGNSARLARQLAGMLKRSSEIVNLQKYVTAQKDPLPVLAGATDLVLCLPLYVDGLPSQVIRFMEQAEERGCGGPKRVYVLANMGLYESSQLANLFDMIRQWCGRMDYEYCGGLGVSAGELLGELMVHLPLRTGPTKRLAQGMALLADRISHGAGMEEVYAEPYGFPRWLYILIANVNWDRTARKNGIRPEDLYRRL